MLEIFINVYLGSIVFCLLFWIYGFFIHKGRIGADGLILLFGSFIPIFNTFQCYIIATVIKDALK